ncbi:DHS-like NAD/FAD-binding domain-containing protein [Lepidopterella palustris CBS 459.81]|uniref:DHS-like NAD/FAD-binding domain-containing protein n=1 Tax=Lepidopterella palustris CBS 459.81 TaxID=1314670 RepID=A0A8E2ELE4_9PEZI|nr:DHS-like NAD/FAD-binding domain-containing protein [Lepidopterella palustris CBS 459.81]
MPPSPPPDYSSVISATGFLRPRASRSLSTFQSHLSVSVRTLSLLGAGLSAPSGLQTFRGLGGLWRTYDAKELSTPAAFERNPALVWTFYLERRRAARAAHPNKAHKALAEMAQRVGVEGFLAISMNIDGLSERAGHPPEALKLLHGNLFDIKCTKCEHILQGDAADEVIQSLEKPSAESSGSPALRREDIPKCSSCQSGLLRPAVVWFNEPLPFETLSSIYSWIQASPTIDTMLVIGTSAEVYPATAYIEVARQKGARIAVVNVEKEDVGLLALEEQDWYFEGHAAVLVPEMLSETVA